LPEIGALDYVACIVVRERFHLLVLATPSVAAFVSLFDKIVSSEINDAENGNHAAKDDPSNIIGRECLLDMVHKFLGHRRSGC